MALLGYPADQVKTAKLMNGAADLLNTTIAISALANGARYVPVAWAFAGHGIPSAAQWIVGPGEPTRSCSIQPRPATCTATRHP